MTTGRGLCPFAEHVSGVTTWEPGCLARVGFCDHVAEGYLSTMRDPGFWKKQGTSVHFAIGKDGAIIQLVNIFDTAWAEGILNKPTWGPYPTMQRETNTGNPNAWLISTEHEGFTGEPWTDAMYAADLRLKNWCITECRDAGFDLLRFGADSLAGHYMFDQVNRKNCPGTGWPRERLWADLQPDPVPAWQPSKQELKDAAGALWWYAEQEWGLGKFPHADALRWAVSKFEVKK